MFFLYSNKNSGKKRSQRPVLSLFCFPQAENKWMSFVCDRCAKMALRPKQTAFLKTRYQLQSQFFFAFPISEIRQFFKYFSNYLCFKITKYFSINLYGNFDSNDIRWIFLIYWIFRQGLLRSLFRVCSERTLEFFFEKPS